MVRISSSNEWAAKLSGEAGNGSAMTDASQYQKSAPLLTVEQGELPDPASRADYSKLTEYVKQDAFGKQPGRDTSCGGDSCKLAATPL